MNILKLLLAEIAYRKLSFLFSLMAITIAVTLFVVGPVLVDGYARETESQVAKLEAETAATLDRLSDETRKLMRDMGFNLLIVHRDTNMSDFWAADFATHNMPQKYADRLAQDQRLTYVTHLVATLQQKITWQDRKVLLVGYLPESTQSHMQKKKPMGYNVEPGTALLGHELGIGHEPGETIEILGRPLRIARILPEQGSKEDITIAIHLEDAQAVLEMPGRINQIMALGCRCAGSNLPNIRRQLAQVLPQTRVTEFRSIALARAEQRDQVAAQQKQILADMAASRQKLQQTMESLAAVMTPVVVLACAIWVGLLALANVRQRRTEIGILRALGKGSATIAGLFLGKAILLGLLGAVLGFLLGSLLAQWLGVRALEVASSQFTIHYDMLAVALVGAPLLSAMASYLPTLSALVQDPAVVLREC
ncbi:MAG: hypothetical protein A2V70_07410 [Planctomycetes bacterium RBG_13_63_9]|nr:MAG: hypothetical protein A2V70_07410 [Planctomycetes bacterium RBG_13_63_9]